MVLGKCVFKEYDIVLHGKQYKVLVPGTEITEMWINLWQTQYKNGDWDAVILNRMELKYLRAAYIALYQNPYCIVYFPIQKVEQILEMRYVEQPPDLVLYTHQLQLKRSKWREIKQCMKYIKSIQCVIRFNIPELIKTYENVLHQWKKGRTFYKLRQWKYRDEERLFYEHNTCFVESSRKQAIYAAVEIQHALERNLEKELEEEQYLSYTAGSRIGGMSYEFATKEFLRKREEEGWRYLH